MNCQDCEPLLPDYVSGALPTSEQSEVRHHLASGCASCHEECDRLREAFASLALTTPPVTPPAKLRAELLARVREDLAAQGDASAPIVQRSHLSSTPSRRRLSWRAAAPYVAVTLCAILAGVASVRWADRQVASREALQREFQQRMAEAQRLFPPHARRAPLARVGASAADGQLVWDSVAGEVHFYADNLGFPATDSHFELWFVDSADNWTSIARLQSAADGGCAALLRTPENLANVVRAVVTEEPDRKVMDGGATKPAGPQRLVADFSGSSVE